ncbi:MAG: Two-component transcriptional response regulator, LuxR family [uncultured Thermomicrobiales bacterium]|uniref:Phosphate regulon transcriptional regulatory protein PhoB n=1 Tax=uncultured Thermomicrobiales bacterium TaxID=1645740 RepID=A0A6J4UFL4_9BACT|nr:MAG: Two-component transcriptional response regulator, LuxR family [uncultured Thermomicrobiales bacterium]
MASILLVEDERELASLIKRELELVGHTVHAVFDGPSAVEAANRQVPDLIVLDVMLPGFDGLEVTRRIRSTQATPILMLTARSMEIDKVVGLELGADDYLTKPFSMRELQARIAAILRRIELIKAQSQPRTVVERLDFPDLSIDVAGHGVRSQGQPVQLTATEFALLHLLASNPGRVFSREFLLEEVWGDDVAVFDRTIDSHIQRLRKKLGGTDSPGDLIETVWGVGYRFAARRSP